jgi:uncharacterized protein (TIGR02594 family)
MTIQKGEQSLNVKKVQNRLRLIGMNPGPVDGIFGPKTETCVKDFQRRNGMAGSGIVDDATLAALELKLDIEMPAPKPVEHNGKVYMAPIDWLRHEQRALNGVKEVPGSKDNPRIVEYHKHSGNLGSAPHHDEVPWCSSVLNCAADNCGMEKSDSALAASWDKYGVDSGDNVEEGDIVTIRHASGGRHVCLANKGFSRNKVKSFEALGGNQGNQIKVSSFSTAHIVAARKWIPKPGTVHNPVGSKPGESEADGSKESTR